jgi:hypothetical protein
METIGCMWRPVNTLLLIIGAPYYYIFMPRLLRAYLLTTNPEGACLIRPSPIALSFAAIRIPLASGFRQPEPPDNQQNNDQAGQVNQVIVH